MTWTVEYSLASERDFELIFDHLLATYLDLGEDAEVAFDRAADRLRSIRTTAEALAETPYIGTLRPDIFPNIRFLRKEHAAIWFLPDGERQTIVVAAIFFGAQDHIRHMLTRILVE
ncbi:type II toxin-antitoxin system RelE/ParE family toxin [Rhodobacterales bacterium]|nr:type II toxin-antitoxin system RelE/ParE family toxin [Rhodobacterales bacterium]